MKVKLSFLYPLLIGVLVIICFWIITDVAYGVNMLDAESINKTARLKALGVMVAAIFLTNYFFRFAANSFLSKQSSSYPKISEYIAITGFILLVSNICMYIIIKYINKADFRSGEALMINAAALPMFLLFYFFIRNNILSKRYAEKSLLLEKAKVSQLQTELDLLKFQYHPHFLFNALNTIYFQIDEKNESALESLELLANLLRYQLYDINSEVNISQEVEYMSSYIKFQQLRMTNRLKLECYFDPKLNNQKIQPLLFQPLIENAFKYVGGDYKISIRLFCVEEELHFNILNSISPNHNLQKKDGGIGINNLKRRLELLYQDKFELHISKQEESFSVELMLKLK